MSTQKEEFWIHVSKSHAAVPICQSIRIQSSSSLAIATIALFLPTLLTMLKERKEWKYENTALTESKLSRLDDD